MSHLVQTSESWQKRLRFWPNRRTSLSFRTEIEKSKFPKDSVNMNLTRKLNLARVNMNLTQKLNLANQKALQMKAKNNAMVDENQKLQSQIQKLKDENANLNLRLDLIMEQIIKKELKEPKSIYNLNQKLDLANQSFEEMKTINNAIEDENSYLVSEIQNLMDEITNFKQREISMEHQNEVRSPEKDLEYMPSDFCQSEKRFKSYTECWGEINSK